MPMTWSSLTGAKGSAGSIMNWVGYSKIDIPTILEESQSLIYGILRTREMRTIWTFGMAPGACSIALPARFLDPLGNLRDITNNMRLHQKDQPVLELARVYDSTVTGSFGTDPFTTTAGSAFVSVVQANHGLTEASAIAIVAANPVGGLTLNGTFPVASIIDPNTFVIDLGDDQATAGATGGGSAATYSADVLISGTAGRWAIFDEAINFDVAFQDQTNFRLPYFRSPALLSATNQSNWLTNRYPKLIRVATTAAAAEQMKDDEEYQKGITALNNLVQAINAENEMFMRGGDYETDTPTPGDYY